MGLESFKRYQELNRIGYFPTRIGFPSKVKGGDQPAQRQGSSRQGLRWDEARKL